MIQSLVSPIFCSLFATEYLDSLQIMASRFALFCDENVARIWGEKWHKWLQQQGLTISLFTFPAGESWKTRRGKEALEDQLFSKGFSRDTCCIALGGGVTMDLIGFLAATFCRGVPLVLVPTTLLGMVDACLGGKNGVNCAFGKNLIGTIYPPSALLLDVNVLKTLEHQAWLEGLSEVLKYALIAAPDLFALLQTHTLESLKKKEILQPLIKRSLAIKQDIVLRDPEERLGYRRILNFGHTIAHAIEAESNYTVAHGRALHSGLRIECLISHVMGILSAKTYQQIDALLSRFSMKLLHSPNKANIKHLLSQDKKSIHQQPRFVLLQNVGKVMSFQGAYCTHVPLNIIDDIVEKCL